MVVVTRTPEYLEHHGIQGQKWGIRNGPPYPLDYEQHNSSEKSKNSKGSLDNYVNNNPKSRSAGSNTQKAKRSAKTGETSSTKTNPESKKIDQKESDKQSLRDKRKQFLMDKFGMTEEQAEAQIAFDNRAAIIVALAAAAVGATVSYGYLYNRNVAKDFILKGGSKMYRVATSSSATVHDKFYAALNKVDAKKYAGIYAKQLNGEMMWGINNGTPIYQKVLANANDIKIAGYDTGKRIYEKIAAQNPLIKSIYGEYDEFNQSLMGDKSEGALKLFFDELKSQGYGGVIDVNDAFFSQYNTNRPVILFDQESNINVNKVKRLTNKQINNNYRVGYAIAMAQEYVRNNSSELVKNIASGSSVALGASTAGYLVQMGVAAGKKNQGSSKKG